ncbi:MAG TPA: hypothetical protein VIH06_06055, partial [Ilumatobacteraceae bacterium]
LGTIPIHVGGTSAPALRRAGRLGDGWMWHRPLRSRPATREETDADLRDLTAGRQVIEEHRRVAGREHLPFEVTAGLGDSLDDVAAAAAAGVDRFSCGPGAVGKGGFIDWIKRFADDVISESNGA